MKPQHDEPIFIELDDPPPRGARFIAALVGIVLIALIVVPFLVRSGISPDEVDASRTPRPASSNQICQPTANLPAILDPVTNFALPSWMRICDWFIEPVDPPIDRPPST